MHFDANAADAPEFIRIYTFIKAGGYIPKKDPHIGELSQTITVVSDVNCAFWKFGDKWLLTKEVIAFLENNGYLYHSKNSQGIELFYNSSLKAVIGLKTGFIDGINDNKHFVTVTAIKQDFGGTPTSVSPFEDTQTLLNEVVRYRKYGVKTQKDHYINTPSFR